MAFRSVSTGRASCWHPTGAGNGPTTHAGVEDPRVTWIGALGTHVMTYVAYGPLGPRPAVAVSTDLRRWTRWDQSISSMTMTSTST